MDFNCCSYIKIHSDAFYIIILKAVSEISLNSIFPLLPNGTCSCSDGLAHNLLLQFSNFAAHTPGAWDSARPDFEIAKSSYERCRVIFRLQSAPAPYKSIENWGGDRFFSIRTSLSNPGGEVDSGIIPWGYMSCITVLHTNSYHVPSICQNRIKENWSLLKSKNVS